MQLMTIGDSIAQGFMSLAAARTDLAFSTLIARALGLKEREYWTPDWPKGGHPVNLELLARRIERVTGPDISLLEWPLALATVNRFLDDVEDHYERGPGAPDRPDPSGREFFPNVASRGFSVADAWQVTPELCREMILASRPLLTDDGIFTLPSAGFYRTALRVLNPANLRKYERFSALDWLAHHHRRDGEGVRNLILWLGSNNALGTVVALKVRATNDPRLPYSPDYGHKERLPFNLWWPEHFRADFAALLDRVHDIMRRRTDDWMVFLATIPAVTIAPLAKGVGESSLLPDPFGVIRDGAKYFKYYTYVLFDEEFAVRRELKLTQREAYTIDGYIAGYNRIIRELVEARNAACDQPRYHVVDMAAALLRAAYKRNDGMPTYEFPPEVAARYPMVDTRYFHAKSDGSLEQGGIFSLDGVHPTAIGHGLVAHEFLKVMNAVRGWDLKLDWEAIYASDSLYMRPPRLMPWVREHRRLAEMLVGIIRAAGLNAT